MTQAWTKAVFISVIKTESRQLFILKCHKSKHLKKNIRSEFLCKRIRTWKMRVLISFFETCKMYKVEGGILHDIQIQIGYFSSSKRFSFTPICRNMSWRYNLQSIMAAIVIVSQRAWCPDVALCGCMERVLIYFDNVHDYRPLCRSVYSSRSRCPAVLLHHKLSRRMS